MVNAVNVPAAASSAPDNTAPEPAEAERQAAPAAAPTVAPAVIVTISPEGVQRAEGTGTTPGLSSIGKAYDPADVDRDGAVTPRERAQYDTRLATERAAEAAAQARTPEVDAAVKEYEAVEQMAPPGPAGTAAT